MTFADPRLADLDGFRVEIDRRARTRRRDSRPAAVQHRRDAATRPVAARVRSDRRGSRVRVIVLRAIGEHFSRGGNIKGFLEASPGACFQTRVEHRRAGALRQAGDRRQSRLLLRRRFRNLARLRFPHRFGDLPLRVAGAAARPDPRLGRLGAAAEDRRHHPHQGHRDALASAFRRGKRSTGASRPNASPTPSWRRRPTRWSTSCAAFSPLAQRTAKKLLNDTEDATLSIAIELEGHCYSRSAPVARISAKASRRSTTSASRQFQGR